LSELIKTETRLEDGADAPKLNCWEFKNCGRESAETTTHDLGVCPAAIAHQVDGVNSGVNGGRVCWAVAGTLGQSEDAKTCTATFSEKIVDCVLCDFYQYVLDHEEKFDIYP